MYLALTGHRLKGRDTHHAGIATHFVTSKELPYLHDEICNLDTPSKENISELLNTYHTQCLSDFHEEFSLQQHLEKISTIFSAEALEDVILRLQEDGSDWAQKQLATLSKMSPASMKVTHRQLKAGKTMSLK